jgi:hypothetical protein
LLELSLHGFNVILITCAHFAIQVATSSQQC